MDEIYELYIIRMLAACALSYRQANETAASEKKLFIGKSKRCMHRHPTALYANCRHPGADINMPNCLIDECPLKEEI